MVTGKTKMSDRWENEEWKEIKRTRDIIGLE